MDKTIDINDFKKEQKKRERKEWVKNKVDNTALWIANNKETLTVVVPAVVAVMGGTTKIIKGVSKNIALKQEKELKERFIYDRSLGRYLELKKPLSNGQLKTVLDRKENGEKLGTILQSMNLLK